MDRLLTRRQLLFWLMLVAGSALADDKDDKDKKDKDKKDKDDNKNNDRKKPDRDANDMRRRTLYTQVNLARDGVVALAAGHLETDSPWARFLAPGMWLRADGFWQEGKFLAESLEVLQPSRFCYFRGPANLLGLSGGWWEAWFIPASPVPQRFSIQQVSPGKEIWMLAYSDAQGWVALPPGLPAPATVSSGWWLVSGGLQGSRLTWNPPQRFP